MSLASAVFRSRGRSAVSLKLHRESCKLVSTICLAFATFGCQQSRPVTPPSQRGPVRSSSGLSCLEPDWDVGEVTVKGKPVLLTHAFRIRNESSVDRILRKIESTCGCLVAQDYPRMLRAGEEATITATVKLSLPPGRFRNQLKIADESAPDDPLILQTMGIVATSPALFSTVDPLPLGTVVKGSRANVTLTVARYDGTPVNLRECVLTSTAVRLHGEPLMTTRETFGRLQHVVEIPLVFDSSNVEVGTFESSARILTTTSDPECAACDVKLEGIVVPPETPWKDSIFIHGLAPGEGVDVELTRKPLAHELVSVTLVGSDSQFLRVTPAGASDPGTLAIHIELDEACNFSTSVLRGKVITRVKEASDACHDVAIPFTVVVAAPPTPP